VGSPTAIFRAVRSTVVNAFDRQSWLVRRVHVGREVGKGSPAFADSDSSASVSRVRLARRIQTTLEYVSPNPVEIGVGESEIGSARFSTRAMVGLTKSVGVPHKRAVFAASRRVSGSYFRHSGDTDGSRSAALWAGGFGHKPSIQGVDL
jgi:hypothetical protein